MREKPPESKEPPQFYTLAGRGFDMDTSSRFSAVLSYVPVIGWLYVLLLQRQNAFARFHVRQAIGLILFLIGVFAGWAVITWVLSFVLPFGFLVGNALFALVVAAGIYGVFAWIIGIINASQGRAAMLPVFGRRASQLPI